MTGRNTVVSRLAAAASCLGLVALASAATTGCTDTTNKNIAFIASSSRHATASTQLDLSTDLPGLHVNIVRVTGARSPGGAFKVGDRISVTFRLQRDDSSGIPIEELDGAQTFLSGPSFNYQPVFPEADLVKGSVGNADESYTYTFPPLPATYLEPENYTGKFQDGVLSGQPLLSGTYTFAITAFKVYVKGTQRVKDTANVTHDVLFGTATAIEHREVVTQRSCEQCHENLSHHSEGIPGGGVRTSVTTCVLCHTAGTEDWNKDDATLRAPSDPNAPPSATVEFKVMIHKIHSGSHLPSVNGVGVDSSGNRDYSKKPSRYATISDELAVNDHSDVNFPVFLNLNNAMPKRTGYSALSGTGQNGRTFAQNDDKIRTGAVACDKCHGKPVGDPVGFAPDYTNRLVDYPAPAQGDLAYKQPTRRACGACHDDIDWTKPYVNNGKKMDPQLDDSQCIKCHVGTGDNLDTVVGHLHPLKRPSIQPSGAQGISWLVSSVTPMSGGMPVATLTAGCKLQMKIAVLDDNGRNIDIGAIASGLANISVVLAGPTTNYNLVQYTAIPPSYSGFSPPQSSYLVNVPDVSFLERVANATGVGGTALPSTALTPHWSQYTAAAPTYVHEAKGAAVAVVGTLSVAATAGQNWIDIAQPTSGTFANKDYIVIDRGLAGEEYLRVTLVDANFRGTGVTRLWFTSKYSFTAIGTTFSSLYGPWLRKSHVANATVSKVTLTLKTAGTHYTLDTGTGVVTELAGGFTAGNAVLVSYTGDWVMPSVYPIALNNSPDLDDSVGKWSGKTIVDGTYTIGVWSAYTWTYNVNGENNTYRLLSTNFTLDFLVGSTATSVVPFPTISKGDANCTQCHDEVMFHGSGRQDFVTCILCHGTSGAEDKPRYIGVVVNSFAGTPDTRNVSVKFSNMLHKIHRGEDLAKGATYMVVGNSPQTPSTYGEVVFPAGPERVRQCHKCHGLPDPSRAEQVWDVPRDRSHPTQQVNPMNRYTFVCGSCHDTNDAAAHFALMSSGGQESCFTCHGSPGATYFTGTVHQNQRKKY